MATYRVGDHGREHYQGRHISGQPAGKENRAKGKGPSHTGLFGIVGIEFGGDPRSYRHLDEEYDSVQKGLE